MGSSFQCRLRDEITDIIGRILGDCQEGVLYENVLDSILFRFDFLRSTLTRYQSPDDSNSFMDRELLNELLELSEEAANTASTISETFFYIIN